MPATSAGMTMESYSIISKTDLAAAMLHEFGGTINLGGAE
jgi:hypothetical protein